MQMVRCCGIKTEKLRSYEKKIILIGQRIEQPWFTEILGPLFNDIKSAGGNVIFELKRELVVPLPKRVIAKILYPLLYYCY